MLFNNNEISKDNLDLYLKELGKEFRKLNGTTLKAEIILIGGASILVNYAFRESTTDVDAIIQASSAMKDAIHKISEKHSLPYDWLNNDFKNTASYSTKLIEISKPYKTFSNIMNVRTVSAEYLIAMKLCSGRKYKNDLSDIVGIFAEHQKIGTPINKEKVKLAVMKLYNSWDAIPKSSQEFFDSFTDSTDYEKLYTEIKKSEESAKQDLLRFNKKYPNVISEDNVNDVLSVLKKTKKKIKEER